MNWPMYVVLCVMQLIAVIYIVLGVGLLNLLQHPVLLDLYGPPIGLHGLLLRAEPVQLFQCY
jgi:hypothetical protein